MRHVHERSSVILQPALLASDARRQRRQLVDAAAWLQSVWGDEEVALPAFSWESLMQLPAWVLCPAWQLDRLALLIGTLFAAPALRRCLHAGPLLRVRDLLGADTLDRVLALPDDTSLHGPEWPLDEADERNTLHAWGAALLVAGVEDAPSQASLIRALSLSPGRIRRGLPPADLGRRMTALGIEILESLGGAQDTPTLWQERVA